MSHYEGINTNPEKIMIVLDIGTAYTKFGFAGEPSPRCIIPSEVRMDGTIRRIFDYKDKNDLYDILVEFMLQLYMKYGLISPKDRSVIVVESVLSPTVIRETLAKALFCHFEVPSIVWLPSHLVALSTLVIDTALVLDVGYSETIILPVCEGVTLLQLWKALPNASQAVERHIQKVLESEVGHCKITDAAAEDIKVRACFVTNLERAKKLAVNQLTEPCPDVEFSVNGSQSFNVTGKLRESAYEELFEKDCDYQSLPTLILDTIVASPIDYQKRLAENIVVIGGTAMALGFKARLKQELEFLVQTEPYKTQMHVKNFKFHTPPCKDNYTAWLGGAIYGCTDVASSRALTKEKYLSEKRVPDCSNLIDNDGRTV